MAASRSRWLVALAAMAIAGAGCGANASSASRSAHTHARAGASADPGAVSVIRAWATALRRGDVNGAARYFALPSEFVNGPYDAVTIRTEAQARAVNETLPCGAQLISVDRHGHYVSALFRLTGRSGPHAGCGSGIGQLARTDFVIAKGRIVEWIRAPDSGSDGSPGPSAPSPAEAGGPVV
jgi:hypothetical protein